MHIDKMTPIQALCEIRSLCNPMDAKFDKIRDICNSFINTPVGIANTECVNTVGELVQALHKMPRDAKVCGSTYVEKHDEYDCEVKPFRVAHYNDGTDDGLVYVGIDYKHPN